MLRGIRSLWKVSARALVNILYLTIMDQQPSTIFEDFQDNPPKRRRALLSWWLIIYVCAYMLLGLMSVIGTIQYFTWGQRNNFIFLQDISLVTMLSSLSLPVLRFLSGILILTERRWAILIALIVAALSAISWAYQAYRMLALGADLPFIFPSACWMALEIPYIILLIRIKNEWEKKR